MVRHWEIHGEGGYCNTSGVFMPECFSRITQQGLIKERRGGGSILVTDLFQPSNEIWETPPLTAAVRTSEARQT